MKNRGGEGFFQISSLTYMNQVIILQCGLPSCTLPKKVSISPLGKKKIYLETQLNGEFIYWFIFKIERVLPFPSHFTWALIWQKSCLLITVLFWKLQQYSLFLHRQSKQRIVNTLLKIRINPKGNRLLIFICQEKNKTWLASPISR